MLTRFTMALTLLGGLSACGWVSTKSVYEGIRAQENAKAVGSGAAPASKLPPHDQYQKERSVLSSPENR